MAKDTEAANRAVREYLATLDVHAAFGAASDQGPEVRVTFRSGSAMDRRDAGTGVLRPLRQLSDRREGWRHHGRRGVARHPPGWKSWRRADHESSAPSGALISKPAWLAGDTAYGSGKNLDWLVNDKGYRATHPSDRQVDTQGWNPSAGQTSNSTRSANVYVCPANKTLTTTGTVITKMGRRFVISPARPKLSGLSASRRNAVQRPLFALYRRSIYEEAQREVARGAGQNRGFREQSRRERKRVEMLFAHLKRVSCGWAVSDCAGHAAPSSSSRWQRSHRTSAGSPNCSSDHHQP